MAHCLHQSMRDFRVDPHCRATEQQEELTLFQSLGAFVRDLTVLVVLCFCFASAATADSIPMSPELKAFMIRPEQQQGLVGLMGQQWRMVVDNCPSPNLQGMNVLISTPPNFDSNGAPVSGQWRAI